MNSLTLTYPPALLDQLERFDPAPLADTVFRIVFVGRSPSDENRGGARWNPSGTAAIYTSRDRETVLAESNYVLSLNDPPIYTPRILYRIRVSLQRVLDLTEPTRLAAVGLTPGDISTDDRSKCQLVGGAVEWLGNDGLLVPSARYRGANLVIYPDKAVDLGFDIEDKEDVPAGSPVV